jgi:hypothetical protein
MDPERAVLLEQDHPVAGAKARRCAAVAGDLAAGDQNRHEAPRYRGQAHPLRSDRDRSAVSLRDRPSGSL